MSDSSQIVAVGFRFLSLSEPEIDRFRDLLPGAGFEQRSRQNSSVVSFDVDSSLDLDALCRFIAEVKPEPTDYGTWISLTMLEDQGGVTLPDFALEIIRRAGGDVDISVICLLPEDDESE